ncbi:MAG: class B sortase, partial [Ruminococcus sp.]|nr:class B sortase [Ruminococcus sp.]
DDYYLNMTMDGKYGLPGSIYTEKYNAQDFSDRVTVIYGHTMHDGTMFSELKKYRDRAFFDQNPYIYIYLPTARLKYQIFAAVAFDNRYILGEYSFSSPEDFESYTTELKSSLDGNINENVEINNPIITLSTCIDEFPNQRWLVNAVLLEEQR